MISQNFILFLNVQ